MTEPHLFSGSQLARSVGFGLLDAGLARDVRASLRAALGQGVVFSRGTTPLAIFREAVATAIGRTHEDGRAPLFQRFLKDGPYEDVGEIKTPGRRL